MLPAAVDFFCVDGCVVGLKDFLMLISMLLLSVPTYELSTLSFLCHTYWDLHIATFFETMFMSVHVCTFTS